MAGQVVWSGEPREGWLRPSAVFARRLRDARKGRGLSQTELAARVTERGRPLSKAALLRIENGTRGLTLDEAVALAAVLRVAPAHLLSPPEGALVALHDKEAVDGDGMRNWLLTGEGVLAWPETPRDEDRETLRSILVDKLTQHAASLVDAAGGPDRKRDIDKAGVVAAIEAMQAAFSRHGEALAAIERKG